jgi:protein O-mannosyl-transferase
MNFANSLISRNAIKDEEVHFITWALRTLATGSWRALYCVPMSAAREADPAVERAPELSPSILRRTSVLLILAATFVVYIGTLTFEFVYDDHQQIVRNPLLHSWRFVAYYFAHDVWSQQSVSDVSNYYRPVFLLWLRIDEFLFGLKPEGWHAGAVALHLLATWLVYRLTWRLLGDRWQACLAAGLFGLDPIHLEAVAWISGSSETLMASLLLGSILCYLNYRDCRPHRAYWLASSLLLFGLASLAKETTLILPFLIFGYAWIYSKSPPPGPWARAREAVSSSLLYFLVAAAYLAARVEVLGSVGHTITAMPWRVLAYTWPSILWFYTRLLIWPAGLSVFYDNPYVSHPTLANFYAPLAGVALIGAALVWWSLRSRIVAFASLWLVLAILPVLDFRVFGPNEIAHDRYLYLPSVGFVILASLLISRIHLGQSRLFGRPATQIIAAGAILGAFAIGTVWQSAFWANDLVLCYRATKEAPGSADANNLLGVTLMNRRDWKPATALFNKAIELQPQYIGAYSNLALVYSRTGDYARSEAFARHALKMDPDRTETWLIVGVDQLELGRVNEAVQSLRRAAELAPLAYRVHYALGIALRKSGNLKAALDQFRAEPASSPEAASVRRQIAQIESQMNGAENKDLGSGQNGPGSDQKRVGP